MTSNPYLQTAFVLCAGFGTRMGALTQAHPKPLLPVAGVSFLDRILKDLVTARIPNLIVNTHYFPDQIRDALIPWKDAFQTIHISQETEILGTGGALARIQPHLMTLQESAFFVVNTDTLFRSPLSPSYGACVFQNLSSFWNAEDNPEILLALIPQKGTQKGDFCMREDKKILRWPISGEVATWIYGGVSVYKTELLEAAPSDASFHASHYWNLAMKRDGLKGMVWEGDWFNLGTKEAYEAFHTQAL